MVVSCKTHAKMYRNISSKTFTVGTLYMFVIAKSNHKLSLLQHVIHKDNEYTRKEDYTASKVGSKSLSTKCISLTGVW